MVSMARQRARKLPPDPPENAAKRKKTSSLLRKSYKIATELDGQTGTQDQIRPAAIRL